MVLHYKNPYLLPTPYHPWKMATFILAGEETEVVIDCNKEKSLEKVSIVTIFVSKDESNAINLQREIEEVNFSDRTNSAKIVGYLE